MTALPNSSARWQPRLTPAPSAGGQGDSLLAVPKIADLTALDTTLIDDGGGVVVKSVFDLWLLDKTKPLAPDGITIAASDDGLGYWFRKCLEDVKWRMQPVWHINPVTGDDENSGATALAPLKSFDEWARRVGNSPLLVSQTIYFDADYTGDCDIRCTTPEGVTLTLEGTRTVLWQSRITGVQDYAPAANQDGRIADAVVPVSWTASGLVNWLLEILDGAGLRSAGWVVRDLAAKTCRHSPLFEESAWTVLNTNVGAIYRVVSLTALGGAVRVLADASVRLRYLQLQPVDAMTVALYVGEGSVSARYCRVESLGATCESGGSLDLAGCLVLGSSGAVAREGGVLVLTASAMEARPIAGRSGVVRIALSSIGQYGAAGLQVGLLANGGGHLVAGAPYGVFDQPTAAGSVIDVDGLGSADVSSYLWGTGNTTDYGLIVRAGGRLTYEPAALPLYATPAVADILVGANPGAYADLPLHDVTHLCGALEAT
jgi:hypothetical protein